MTPPRALRRGGKAASVLVLGIVATLALSGCGQGAPPEPGSPAGAARPSSPAGAVVPSTPPAAGLPSGRPAAALPSSHVHGVSRDPGSGRVNLATHEGLFVLQSDASWQQVGPVVDLMGFAVSGPGAFYSSGHPAAGVDLPSPVGLMKSTDAGRTWTVLSRGGESDFHALTASSAGVMGYDGALRTTKDGKNWADGGLSVEPRALAAAPDGSQVLATTGQGLLRSTDEGQTWAPAASAPPLFLIAWADSKTVVGVTTEGGLAVSADAGGSWKIGAAKLTSGQAVSASRDSAGVLEILVVTDTGVVQSRDNGATVTALTS